MLITIVGLVKCSNCGSSLNASHVAKLGRYNGFSCWVYKNYGKQRCTSHAIGWKTLNTIVLNDIRMNAMVAAAYQDHYLEMLLERQGAKHKKELEKGERRMGVINKRLADLDRIIKKLFEESALGAIPDVRARSMMGEYEREADELS